MAEQADTDNIATNDVEQQHNVSFPQNEVDNASGGNNENTDINEEDKDDEDNKPLEPLYHSTRLKGYTTLLVSAIYNYLAAADKHNENMSLTESLESKLTNLCMSLDDMGNLVERDYTNISRLRYAMACSMITIIITGIILLCHFDFCTPMRKTVWQKAFGPHGKVELWILLFFTFFWCISVWFITTIRGPGGEGKEQYNLFFSSWLCLWASMWTLERWCTCTGRASFERFVKSWPNRCPMWIITFIWSFADFLFVLDTFRNWEEGTQYAPYTLKLYSDVKQAEWTLLFFVTCLTYSISFAWVLAEIFRENVNNVDNVKSDVEFFVEGIFVHILALLWIITVCITTMPAGAASLLGNLYFTTWSTLFAVVGTLIWFVRDWRHMILGRIQEKQDEYDMVKKGLRIREEERRARLKEQERKDQMASRTSGEDESSTGECKSEEEEVLCEYDPCIDDDITISITSGIWHGHASLSPSLKSGVVKESSPVDDSGTTSGLFMSALSYFYTPNDEQPDDNDEK